VKKVYTEYPYHSTQHCRITSPPYPGRFLLANRHNLRQIALWQETRRYIMDMAILKEFFMWCTLINLGLFMWSAIMCMACKGMIQRVHGKMFGLGPETINTMLYGFLAFYKIVFIVFCLVPWIALTIVS
jgi:hypothetical protein